MEVVQNHKARCMLCILKHTFEWVWKLDLRDGGCIAVPSNIKEKLKHIILRQSNRNFP